MTFSPVPIYYDEAGNVIPEQSDPTLTDFQKLRLETALKLHPDSYSGLFSEAIAKADELINLVINTPFKPTND